MKMKYKVVVEIADWDAVHILMKVVDRDERYRTVDGVRPIAAPIDEKPMQSYLPNRRRGAKARVVSYNRRDHDGKTQEELFVDYCKTLEKGTKFALADAQKWLEQNGINKSSASGVVSRVANKREVLFRNPEGFYEIM